MNGLFYEKWRRYQFYVIIGVLSVVALLFLPMIGSEAGLAWVLPTTAIGWIVYVITKLLVAMLNIMIFHCFVQQGKVNILENERYIQAQDILRLEKDKDAEIPRSPTQWAAATYGKKGATIFITTLVSAVGLTQAVLTFDWMSMLTYLFTIIMGVIFGIIQMNSTETYWTEEYYRYALFIQKRNQEQAKAEAEKALQAKNEERVELASPQSVEPPNDTTYCIRRADILVATNTDGVDGDNN